MNEQEHRYRCEVRHCIKLGIRKKLDPYLEIVQNKRGKEAADRLRQEARRQYGKGNRGDFNVWFE